MTKSMWMIKRLNTSRSSSSSLALSSNINILLHNYHHHHHHHHHNDYFNHNLYRNTLKQQQQQQTKSKLSSSCLENNTHYFTNGARHYGVLSKLKQLLFPVEVDTIFGTLQEDYDQGFPLLKKYILELGSTEKHSAISSLLTRIATTDLTMAQKRDLYRIALKYYADLGQDPLMMVMIKHYNFNGIDLDDEESMSIIYKYYTRKGSRYWNVEAILDYDNVPLAVYCLERLYAVGSNEAQSFIQSAKNSKDAAHWISSLLIVNQLKISNSTNQQLFDRLYDATVKGDQNLQQSVINRLVYSYLHLDRIELALWWTSIMMTEFKLRPDRLLRSFETYSYKKYNEVPADNEGDLRLHHVLRIFWGRFGLGVHLTSPPHTKRIDPYIVDLSYKILLRDVTGQNNNNNKQNIHNIHRDNRLKLGEEISAKELWMDGHSRYRGSNIITEDRPQEILKSFKKQQEDLASIDSTLQHILKEHGGFPTLEVLYALTEAPMFVLDEILTIMPKTVRPFVASTTFFDSLLQYGLNPAIAILNKHRDVTDCLLESPHFIELITLGVLRSSSIDLITRFIQSNRSNYHKQEFCCLVIMSLLRFKRSQIEPALQVIKSNRNLANKPLFKNFLAVLDGETTIDSELSNPLPALHQTVGLIASLAYLNEVEKSWTVSHSFESTKKHVLSIVPLDHTPIIDGVVLMAALFHQGRETQKIFTQYVDYILPKLQKGDENAAYLLHPTSLHIILASTPDPVKKMEYFMTLAPYTKNNINPNSLVHLALHCQLENAPPAFSQIIKRIPVVMSSDFMAPVTDPKFDRNRPTPSTIQFLEKILLMNQG